MPLSERDPNYHYNGRQSRGSNVSNSSRSLHPKASSNKSDLLANTPGVMSMLRSSTEMGNDALFNPPSRFANTNGRPRNPRRQSGTSSRMSAGSGHSSRRASTHHGSSHQAWPSVSSAGRRRSITSNVSHLNVPHYLDPSLSNLSDPSMAPPAPHFRDGGGRSFSLTHTSHHPSGLTNYRSLTSLRSHEPYARPKSPYKYPTRLKRPGYRPSSPALSDVSGLHSSRAQHTRLGSGLRMAHGPGSPPVVRPVPLYVTGRNRSSPSVNSLGNYDQIPGAYPRQGTPSLTDQSVPVMTPSQYAALQYSHLHAGPSRQDTPSLTDHFVPAMTSGAYHGQQLPELPSSDPPSSSPPTPRNVLSIDSAEPLIITHAQVPIRAPSPSATNTAVYYDYSEQYDPVGKHVVQMYHETTSAPIPLGFVQRIKTILEERSVSEHDAASPLQLPLANLIELPAGDIHELPATPIIQRITRELILANLNPSSDIRDSVSPHTEHQFNTQQHLDSYAGSHGRTLPSGGDTSQTPGQFPSKRDSQISVASEDVTTRTNSTAAAAVLNYALQCSMRSTMSLEACMQDEPTEQSILVPPAPDGPTEPVTIARVEVEVTAPTPTQPWTPKFHTPDDMTRPQSALLASSVYSSSRKDNTTTKFSTPTTQANWPLKDVTHEPSTHSKGSDVHGIPDSRQTTQDMNRHSIAAINQAQQRSSTSLAQRVAEAHHARRQSDSRQTQPLPDTHRSIQPSGSHHAQQSFETHRSQRPSENDHAPVAKIPTPPPPAKSCEPGHSFTFSSFTLPTAVQIAVQEPTFVTTHHDSPISSPTDSGHQAPNQRQPSPVSPLSAEESYARRESMNFTHLSNLWSYRKPVPKRSSSPVSIGARNSLKDTLNEPEQVVDNSTTELRFSKLLPLTRQLDDVKEEPTLERSSVDLMGSSIFRFPLPQRKSSLAHFENVRLSRESKPQTSSHDAGQEAAEMSRSRTLSDVPTNRASTFRPPSGVLTLAEMREIPSLNFSRVNLFEKLNDALDLRRTTSTDGLSRLVDEPKSRPCSSSLMREKYKSFFQTLDGLTCDFTPDTQTNREYKSQEDGDALASPRDSVSVPSRLRPMSADELMAELDRISIPSIQGLTQRLSELLPSLKRYYGESGDIIYEEDETVRSTIDEIRKLGQAALEGMEEDIKVEGSALRVRSCVVEGLLSSPTESLNGSNSNLRGSRPRSASTPGLRSDAPVTPIAELEASIPAALHSRSLSDGSNSPGPVAIITDRSKLARVSERSLRNSPASSRPWNIDANYPWADKIPSMDISLLAPTLRRDVVSLRPSKLRLRMSRESQSNSDDVRIEFSNATTAPGDPTESTSATADTFSNNHRRKNSKPSILGSLTRKMGLGNSFDQGGFATGPEILRGEDRTVDPGDRYPTTGLSPPSALNIDEVRSFFSDDSSAHGEAAVRGVSFRKRLTNLRTRMPMARAHSAMENRSAPAPSDLDLRRSNSLFVPHGGPRVDLTSTTTAIPLEGEGVAGMAKTEFRTRKLVEKMKTLWYKGGELLRSLSHVKGRKHGTRSGDGTVIGEEGLHDWEEDGESAHWSED